MIVVVVNVHTVDRHFNVYTAFYRAMHLIVPSFQLGTVTLASCRVSVCLSFRAIAVAAAVADRPRSARRYTC